MNQSHNITTHNTWFLDFTTWISGDYRTCVELKQDYKIATKTIAHRLEKVLEHDSDHPTQTDNHLKKKPTLLSQCWRWSASSQSQIRRQEDLVDSKQTECMFSSTAGADPGFFLGGGALVSCSASTPINHKVFFFLQNTSCIRKPQVISGEGAHPPHPPPRSAPVLWTY